MRPTVLLTSVSSDSHTWNLVYLHLLLEEHGCVVTNLGACTPDELVAEAVREHRPDVLVISSVNGHGAIDGARVMRLLAADPVTASVPAVIGGKLGIAGALDLDAEAALLAAGFQAVLSDPQQLVSTITALAGQRRPEPIDA